MALLELANIAPSPGARFRTDKCAGAMKPGLRTGVGLRSFTKEPAMTVRTAIEQATKSVMGALSPNEGEADILDTLQTEHDEVQEFLKKLVDSDNAREQKQLVEKVKRALVPHTKAEEKVVYDAVLALRGKDAKVDGNEGYIEHGLADQTLKKLDKLTANSPEFTAAAKVLKELIDHHVQEEERNIWAQVKDNFSSEQREQMNRDFLASKKKVKVA
jgi:hemerythrin superfamily protein